MTPSLWHSNIGYALLHLLQFHWWFLPLWLYSNCIAARACLCNTCPAHAGCCCKRVPEEAVPLRSQPISCDSRIRALLSSEHPVPIKVLDACSTSRTTASLSDRNISNDCWSRSNTHSVQSFFGTASASFCWNACDEAI